MSAGRNVNTKSQDWCTPKKYVDAVKCFFGGRIDLDPCSNKYSIARAKTEYCLPTFNGLKESWNFTTIYVNPPYGINKKNKTTIKDWIERCCEANRLYKSEVIALVPVATNTRHWKEYIFGRANSICFLDDTRLKFLINGESNGKGAPMACAMIYWGKNARKFYDVFYKHGAVINITNLIKKKWSPPNIKNQKKLFSIFDK
ncbi:N-6 DNA methylase [Candidatus Falkowbacteria bacterium]|nr:N-6 DNA methylase [Candidatus Falkowbacteria bacterium]